jgi:guanylate kinase
VNGSDYLFISEAEFVQLEHQNFFLETSRFGGNIYGSPATLVDKLKCGISLVLVTDLDGIRSLKSRLPECVSIWIAADEYELQSRLHERGTEDSKTIARRLELAAEHTALARKEHLIDQFVTNKSFEHAVGELAELMRKHAAH